MDCGNSPSSSIAVKWACRFFSATAAVCLTSADSGLMWYYGLQCLVLAEFGRGGAIDLTGDESNEATAHDVVGGIKEGI